MKRVILLVTVSALLMCAYQQQPPVQMDHAVKVCDENCTITEIYMGAPTIFQYGAGSGWSQPYLFQTALPWRIDNWTPEFGAYDPNPGVYKELDVQQTIRPVVVFFRQYDGTVGSVSVPALPGSN